jgi:hypothetical protein
MLAILRLESSARVLIPHWEEAWPPEACTMPTGVADETVHIRGVKARTSP